MNTITMNKESAIDTILTCAKVNDRILLNVQGEDMCIWKGSDVEGKKADKEEIEDFLSLLNKNVSSSHTFVICSYECRQWVKSFIVKVA